MRAGILVLLALFCLGATVRDEPYAGWLRSSKVEWSSSMLAQVELHSKPCPYLKLDARNCTDSTGAIWIPTPTRVLFYHEMTHAGDFLLMTRGDRWRQARWMRRSGELDFWYSNNLAEHFAVLGTACALYGGSLPFYGFDWNPIDSEYVWEPLSRRAYMRPCARLMMLSGREVLR